MLQCFDLKAAQFSTRTPPSPRVVEVELRTPVVASGGPFLFIFFSLSAKSDLAVIKVGGDEDPCTILASDPQGNIRIKMVYGENPPTEVRFKSWCSPCMLPICFQVMGQTQVRKCSSWDDFGGWCLLGQGEVLGEGLVALRHTPLELERQAGFGFPDIEILKCNPLPPAGCSLPVIPPALDEWVEQQSAWRRGLPFNNSSFLRISHPQIAVHSGFVPRDLYYLKGINATNKYLNAILEVGFVGSSWRGVDDAVFARMVVFSVTHFVNMTVDYQPDAASYAGEHKEYEYFSKWLLIFMKKGDCEDLAWYATSLLESIQDCSKDDDDKYPLLKRAREVLDDYIATSAIVQGTAPQFRDTPGNLHIEPAQEFIDDSDEMRAQRTMHVFHVTSFLFPKYEFLECVERGRDFSSQGWTKVNPTGKQGLHRLYVEGTSCVGEDALLVELTKDEERMVSPTEALCVPIGRESPNSSLIYGAVIEVITSWFLRKKIGPKCMTFVVDIQKCGGDGKISIAPEDCHWGCKGATFAFIPSIDMTPILPKEGDETITRVMSDIPVPWLKEPPGEFQGRLDKLSAHFKGGSSSLFKERFFWTISSSKPPMGTLSFESPWRNGVWLSPPPAQSI